MDIDIAERIGAVRREVRTEDREGEPVRELVASRTYDTDAPDLWDALTNPERIPRWFLPVSGELRPGGRYQLEGNAGGEIHHCEPPRHLSVSWEYGEEVSWLDVRLEEQGPDRTRLELRHTAVVDDERWGQFGPGATGVGWDLALLGLGLHLESGAGVDPAEVAGWSASPGGHDFLSRSSSAWGRASVAAGTDEAQATSAAANTTAFYTGADAPAETVGEG